MKTFSMKRIGFGLGLILLLVLVVIVCLQHEKSTVINMSGSQENIQKSMFLHSVHVKTDATEREAGRSHACFNIQKGIANSSAIFFSHLRPQPNGAAFASFQFSIPPQKVKLIDMTVKNLVNSKAFYQVIVGTPYSEEHGFSYVKLIAFDPFENKQLRLTLSEFEPSYRGRNELPDFVKTFSEENDLMTSVGLRINGRVGDVRQQGVHAIDLELIEIH